MPARAAGVCGLLAFLAVNVGWIVGGLAQPDSYSAADDDISDLGALTASSAWIYNQIGANLTGLLVVVLGLGLWRVLSPDLLGRLGALAVVVAGIGTFLDGLFRLDCRGSTQTAPITRGTRTRWETARPPAPAPWSSSSG